VVYHSLEYLNHINYSSSLLIPYGYGFPNWTYGYGIFIFLVSVLQIPLWAIFKLCYNTWDNERKVLDIFKPNPEKWKPRSDDSKQQEWLKMNEPDRNGSCSVFWCASCQTYVTANKLGKDGCLYAFLYCICPTIPIILLRHEARQKSEIRGSIHDDIMTSYFCGSCVMCQTAVERDCGLLRDGDSTEMNSVHHI